MRNRNQQQTLKVDLSNTNLQRPRRDFGSKRDLDCVSFLPVCRSIFFEAYSSPLLFSRFLPSVRFPSVHFPSVHFTSIHFTSVRFTQFNSVHFTQSLHFGSIHISSHHCSSLHSTGIKKKLLYPAVLSSIGETLEAARRSRVSSMAETSQSDQSCTGSH